MSNEEETARKEDPGIYDLAFGRGRARGIGEVIEFADEWADRHSIEGEEDFNDLIDAIKQKFQGER